jgi:ABC-type antimicrobial peptide transport system permease subunit
MNIKHLIYKLKLRLKFQVVKHSWLDMKRQKAKAIFGIAGVAISLFLLTAIGMINNTISYNYIEIAVNTTGEADILVSRTISADLTYDPFFDEQIIQDNLQNIEGVESLFPRITMLTKTTSDNVNGTANLQMYGMDFEAEHQNGNMGDLVIVNEIGQKTDELYTGEPNSDECIILQNVAELLNVSKGDSIHLTYQHYEEDYVIAEICEQERKFLEFENALVLLNLGEAQNFLNRTGQINFIYGTIENPQLVYDSSNIDLTTRRLRVIGSNIQDRLDLNEYSVSMPKLEELEQGEFLLMGATVIFWFIIMLSMLITGILINSILSTSAEERIREFGILRVVGGKTKFPIKVVLFEGFLLGIIGSIIGIILGLFLTEPIAHLFLGSYDFGGLSNIEFVIQPQTVLIGFLIGIFVSLGVSLIPALKTSKKDIIKSITPFQTEEEGWEVKKESSVKTKSILVGVSISTIGMIIFILMPRIFTTGDFMLTAGLFIGLLAAILIGLVLTSVGIIPLIQRVFLGLISPFIKKYSHIIKISLKRYRRRNTSTIVMFAISFSFIFFVTSLAEMEKENTTLTLKFQYGADLVMINEGGESVETSITMEMINDLKKMDRINDIAIALHNTIDIQRAIAAAYDFSEGTAIMDEDSTQQLFETIFQYYIGEERTKYIVHAADIPNKDEVEAGFIGINQDFTNLIDRNLIIWSSFGSNFEYSFNEMLAHNDTCIISKAIADRLGVQDVGERIRLTFYDPKVENDPGNITLFRVVGISGGIPGFWNFRSSAMAANGGGVMVSLENYMRLMDVENPGESNMIVDKAYINLKDKSEKNVQEFKDDVRTYYEESDFTIDDAVTKIKLVEEMTEQQSALMEIILMFTIIISIFGLISSMYAIMMERKFEIGILRSMGLKTRNVRNMFLIESMILMLSAGIMGTILGSFSAYLLETNMALLTEMPVVFTIPFDTLLRVFLLSVGVGIVGMYIVLLRLSRQSIMDIFRQTF